MRSARRRPVLIVGAVAVAVAVLVATTVFGGRLSFVSGPGASGGTREPSYPALVEPPLVDLTQLGSTPVAPDGSTVTDAHGVTVALGEGSLINASAVQLVASDMPASFDSSLSGEGGWKRASSVYSLELDNDSDVIGTVPLSFPASSPDDRVAVLLDRRYLAVLSVEPADGRLTVQAMTESSTSPAFEGEGDHYFVVTKASASSAPNALALAQVAAAVGQGQQETGSGVDTAPAPVGAATCSYSGFPGATTCTNAAHSVIFTAGSKVGADVHALVGLFLDRVDTIMAKYTELGFVHALPSPADPLYIDLEPWATNARYSPNLIASRKVYLPWSSVFGIWKAAEQQTLAHELFHWVQHHTYPMRADGLTPDGYWNHEVRAEAASFLVDPSYESARLLVNGATLEGDTNGVLGWQKAPFDWDMTTKLLVVPATLEDYGRYVDGHVLALGMCDGVGCIETQKAFAEEVNDGAFTFSKDTYLASLENTARYLLGTAPNGVNVDLAAWILKTGRGVGDYIHISQAPETLKDYAAISSHDSLGKIATSGEVTIHAPIASGAVYPLRVSNGSDVPLDDKSLLGTGFSGLEARPNAPYALHLDAGVEFYWRVGDGSLQHSDGSKPLDIGPITSEASVAARGADGGWITEPGIPSVRIVAINPTQDAVTLSGNVYPLGPHAVASPASLTKLNPTSSVQLRVDLTQVALVFSSATADWDFGDGSPLEQTTITPDAKRQASVSTTHVFKATSTGVRVTFRDKAGKPLAWDPVIIPVVSSSATPGNFNRLVVYMPLGGTAVRKTNLDVKIQMTGPNTFTLAGSEPGIVSLTGTLSDGGKSVTLTIVHANDTENPACADHTILQNLPALKSSGPAVPSVAFGVSGWANVMAMLEDSYPWTGSDNANGGKPIALCTTNKQWTQDAANTGAQVVVTLYY
jgi:hypothetical protein